ncbi:MAG TPA: YceD family protein [Luteimonas sp.]
MSAELPESQSSGRVPDVLDAWRMVAARRSFEGSLPLSSLSRLREVLCDAEGEVRYALDFDRDTLLIPYVELRIEAALPLECQRSLQRFLQPVQIVQRLGLIRDEADEAGLPEGYEPLLLAEDGMLRPAELVEDELILAVPLVPAMPDTEAMERDWPVQGEEEAQANPFAALAGLRQKND